MVCTSEAENMRPGMWRVKGSEQISCLAGRAAHAVPLKHWKVDECEGGGRVVSPDLLA